MGDVVVTLDFISLWGVDFSINKPYISETVSVRSVVYVSVIRSVFNVFIIVEGVVEVSGSSI